MTAAPHSYPGSEGGEQAVEFAKLAQDSLALADALLSELSSLASITRQAANPRVTIYRHFSEQLCGLENTLSILRQGSEAEQI